jgi:beta-fructofuranosidase
MVTEAPAPVSAVGQVRAARTTPRLGPRGLSFESMLRLPDAWTWDFWLADTGSEYHLFFLRAPRTLRDPDLHHGRASVGHAVSTDLFDWTLLTDALVKSDSPAFDDLATWTGSVVQDRDGVWRMFYTGVSEREGAWVQRIGFATSTDLITWDKHPDNPILGPDRRWYEVRGESTSGDEAWRDPWVFADPGGDGWHMLITARAGHGTFAERGVVGHARSADLLRWEAGPPLSAPDSGFGQLEVCQVEIVDGRPVLVFCCTRDALAGERLASGSPGGTYVAAAESLVGPFDIRAATQLTDDALYAGRLIRNRAGGWVLLAFHNRGRDGRFVGCLSDPMPVTWRDSLLALRGPPALPPE